jgi:hypothetical protein
LRLPHRISPGEFTARATRQGVAAGHLSFMVQYEE